MWNSNGFYIFGGEQGEFEGNDEIWFYNSEAGRRGQRFCWPYANAQGFLVPELVLSWMACEGQCHAVAAADVASEASDSPFQANEWYKLSPSGKRPRPRSRHSAVWSDELRGFYVFAGSDGQSTGSKP